MVNGSYNINLWIGRGVLNLVIRGQLHFQIVKGGRHQTLILLPAKSRLTSCFVSESVFVVLCVSVSSQSGCKPTFIG